MKLGLRAKLILISFSSALIASGFVSFFQINRLVEISERKAVEILAAEAELNYQILTSHFENMVQDATVIGSTPPITGLLRTRSASNGVDPQDGSNESLWRNRLEQIFTSLMAIRPHYMQIRFLILDENGLELVRVDRTANGTEAMPPSTLQEKGAEPYMVQLSNSSEPFFSEVTLNREHGQVEPSRTPMLRLVKPVLDQDGLPFGAIVINADYEALLRLVQPVLSDNHTLAVINGNGDHITYSDDGPPSPLQFHENEGWMPLANLMDLGSSGQANYPGDDKTVMFANGSSTLGSLGHDLRVSAIAPTAGIFSDAQDAKRETLWLIAALSTIFGLIAAIFTNRVLRPLSQLTKEVKARGDVTTPISFSSKKQDEVSTLARAFAEQTNELIAQSEQAMTVFSSAADGILTVNKYGRILTANPACLQMFEYDEESLIGQSVHDLLPEDVRANHIRMISAISKNDIKREMAPGREVHGRRKTGETFPAEITISRVREDEETVFTAVCRDISVRKQQHIQLQKAFNALEKTKAELERSNADLEQFAYAASHDLKSPLQTILNGIEMLEEDLEDHLDPDTWELIGLIRKGVHRMQRLLADLLEYSLVSDFERDFEMISGAELLQEIKFLAAVPDTFKLETTAEFDQLTIEGAPLKKILVNLVSNAVKHHDSENGLISISVEETKDAFNFCVIDDGPGIPDQYREKVFEMFTRLKSQDEVEGSGIGLAMVKKVLLDAGSDIYLDAGLDRGACFRFVWPKHKKPDPTISCAA